MLIQGPSMLNFRTAYLQAMREQAPAMFNELRRSGAMDAHLNKKAAEAQAMFRQLTEGAPTLPGSGVLADPQTEREATEQVFGTLITFPPANATPDLPERPPQP